MTDAKKLRHLAAGAALVAVPIVGMRLYYKYAQATELPEVPPQWPQAAADLAAPIPESLIQYEEVRRIDPRVAEANVIAISPEGSLLVGGDREVRIVRTDGEAAQPIELHAPATCIAFAEDGSIYVGLKDHVDILSADGTRTASWPSLGPRSYLTGIAVSAENVYLADSGNRVVLRMDRSGHLLNQIGRPDPSRGIPGFVLPSPHLGVALASDGTIWVNNTGLHRLENYSPDGTLERFWGAAGTDVESFIGCCNPTDFWLLSDGSFITAEKSVARVKHYLADGRFDAVIAAPSSFGSNMRGLGIVADRAGTVFVLERVTGLIHVFERKAGARP